ncbi:hypothetical protein [Prescottella subtropica]|uniref:hypothetical protein n=1 Tax=Prescottella subtropica TaxID=2545757 RepID=UPI0010F4E739|nr:hypothetical protein [Prescottella subtropica]
MSTTVTFTVATPTLPQLTPTPSRMSGAADTISAAVALGSLTGTVVGAAVGAVVGGTGTAVTGILLPESVAAAVGGAMVGASIGAFVGTVTVGSIALVGVSALLVHDALAA